MNQGRPKIAIIDANTLSVLGLKQLLQTAMPFMTVDTYGTMTELMEAETLLLQAENALTDAHISYLTALRKFRDFNK